MVEKDVQNISLASVVFSKGLLGPGGVLWAYCLLVLRRLLIWLLTQGVVPRHVCIVPDGHRRYSKAMSVDLQRAYAMGGDIYSQVHDWCVRVGVEVSTIFVFSARNFSRSRQEVTAILDKVNDAYAQALENFHEDGASGKAVRAIGDLELLPKELSTSMARATVATFGNRNGGSRLDVACAAYTTKRQTAAMALQLAKAVREGVLCTEDINSELLADYTALMDCPEADMLVRTAGDQRFSDFLVFQCNYAYFHLETRKWPELRFFHWAIAMLQFQLQWPAIQAVKRKHSQVIGTKSSIDVEQVLRRSTFLRRAQAARMLYLEGLACSHPATQ
ncbi:dehydrodolichyl diphosphate synthase complex subunit Dhdds-like [Amblyomma americanum]